MVPVIEPDAGALARRVGGAAAARLFTLHVGPGVQFRLGVGVSGLLADADDNVRGVALTDDSTIDAAAVLVAIDCAPDVEWLTGSAIDISDGVQCDEYCRAGPGIWAAGDVARWHHAGIGRRIRVEHRINASEQGAAVAANIVGPLRPYLSTPLFWTDRFDVKLQFVGAMPRDAEEAIEHLADDSWPHTFREQGRLAAALGWNAAKAMMPVRRELAAR